MSEFKLDVTKREANVRNVFRKSLIGNFIPGILYNKKENQPISIPRHFFEKRFSEVKTNTIFALKCDGKEHKAYIKEYTTSLIKNNQIQHIDFYKIESDSQIKIKVPIKIEGLAKGVVQGGYIEHYAWELKVLCAADKIPKEVKVNITDLNIGDRIYLNDLPKIDGVEWLESLSKSIVGVMISSKSASLADAEEAEKATEEQIKDEKNSEKEVDKG